MRAPAELSSTRPLRSCSWDPAGFSLHPDAHVEMHWALCPWLLLLLLNCSLRTIPLQLQAKLEHVNNASSPAPLLRLGLPQHPAASTCFPTSSPILCNEPPDLWVTEADLAALGFEQFALLLIEFPVHGLQLCLQLGVSQADLLERSVRM